MSVAIGFDALPVLLAAVVALVAARLVAPKLAAVPPRDVGSALCRVANADCAPWRLPDCNAWESCCSAWKVFCFCEVELIVGV